MDIRKGRFPEVRINRYESKIKSAANQIPENAFFGGRNENATQIPTFGLKISKLKVDGG